MKNELDPDYDGVEMGDDDGLGGECGCFVLVVILVIGFVASFWIW